MKRRELLPPLSIEHVFCIDMGFWSSVKYLLRMHAFSRGLLLSCFMCCREELNVNIFGNHEAVLFACEDCLKSTRSYMPLLVFGKSKLWLVLKAGRGYLCQSSRESLWNVKRGPAGNRQLLLCKKKWLACMRNWTKQHVLHGCHLFVSSIHASCLCTGCNSPHSEIYFDLFQTVVLYIGAIR